MKYIIYIQFGLLIWAATSLYERDKQAALIQSNLELERRVHELSARVCSVGLKLGETYKITLAKLIEDLKLTPTKSADDYMLEAYDVLGVGGER